MCNALPGIALVARFHNLMPSPRDGRNSNSVTAATAVAPANVCVILWNDKSPRSMYPARTSLSIATCMKPYSGTLKC